MEMNINKMVEIIDKNGIGIKNVAIVPVKLNLPFIKPRDEVYLVGSNRRGNRFVKRANPIGFIIKSRKNCTFFNPYNTNLHIETLNIVNIIVNKINTWDVYYDFKNKRWPKYLVESIEQREQKAKELEQRTKELAELKADLGKVKDKLNAVAGGLGNVCNKD